MASKAGQTSGSAAAIVAALLLPPLGIYLRHGLGPAFWIGVVLTCFAFVPGMIFALVAVLKPEILPRRKAV